MVYFLGRDVKVYVGTEAAHATVQRKVSATGSDWDFTGSDTAETNYTMLAAMRGSSELAINRIEQLSGVDLSIGAMDEDIAYMGHRTPLKAEVHKETTVSLSLKKKNGIYDCIFTGDKDGSIGRWGVTGSALADGLSEPSIEYGFRLAIHIKGAKECFTVRNAAFTGHSISLNADGTQEETLEFTSQVEPVIKDGAYATATTGAQL